MNHVTRRLVFRALLAILVPAALSAIFQSSASVSPRWDASPGGAITRIAALWLVLVALALIGLGGLAVASGKERARGLVAAAIGLSWIGGCFAARPLIDAGNESALRLVVQRADRIVAAIESYELDAGTPPPSLSALVPKYLDASDFPPPGGATLRYSSVNSPGRHWFTWTCELEGAPRSSAGGDSIRPQMKVEFTGRGTVKQVDILFDAAMKRAPVDFDPRRWRQADTTQLGMAYMLRRTGMLAGRDTAEVLRLLGAPERWDHAYPGKWFFAVATNDDILGDSDALILDARTPPQNDASVSRRIGRWWWCPACYERLPSPEPEVL